MNQSNTYHIMDLHKPDKANWSFMRALDQPQWLFCEHTWTLSHRFLLSFFFSVTSSGQDTAPPATEPPQRPSTTRHQPACLHESEAVTPPRGSHTWDTHLSRLFFKKIGFIFICANMFLMISKCLYELHSRKLSPT